MKPGIQKLALLAAPVFVWAACASPPASVDPASSRSALAAGDHSFKTGDGNDMPYVVTGDGDVTVLLIHCWMCDRTFWAAQVPELAKRYRTITLDLPGHGQASATRTSWTVAGYGEDVAGLIQELGLSNVVLVGHSMGGPVALRAAALSVGRVRGIVAVETLHDAEFDFSGPQIEGFLKAFESDYVGTCERFIAQMIPEAGADDVRNHVRQTSCRPERGAIGAALMRNFGAIDTENWFSEAKVPIRAINAAATPTKIDTNRKYADFDAVSMQGVGHYPHMTRPAEFNPLLLAAIAEIVGGVS